MEGPEEQLGDFLIGPKDAYNGIVENDLQYLIHVLDDADKAGVKIVLDHAGFAWITLAST